MDNTDQETTKQLQEEEDTQDTNKFLTLNEGGDLNIGEQVEEDMSSLKSKKTWDKLKIPKPLEDRLIQLGFKQPSKIQATVIPISRKSSVFA